MQHKKKMRDARRQACFEWKEQSDFPSSLSLRTTPTRAHRLLRVTRSIFSTSAKSHLASLDHTSFLPSLPFVSRYSSLSTLVAMVDSDQGCNGELVCSPSSSQRHNPCIEVVLFFLYHGESSLW
mmetsp:Transcript_29791/g.44818  ORF Transcript_29791/g.44818 Transcript_29791/m.44818 type:complete len:124 (-) Transcript_29791:589-960(-)